MKFTYLFEAEHHPPPSCLLISLAVVSQNRLQIHSPPRLFFSFSFFAILENAETTEARELRELKESLEGTPPVGPLVAGAKTLDQVRMYLRFNAAFSFFVWCLCFVGVIFFAELEGGRGAMAMNMDMFDRCRVAFCVLFAGREVDTQAAVRDANAKSGFSVVLVCTHICLLIAGFTCVFVFSFPPLHCVPTRLTTADGTRVPSSCQARALLTFMEAISEKTLRSTVALTASR